VIDKSAGIGTRLNCGENFLSRPEWCERPWKLVPKTPFDELIDLLFNFHINYQAYNNVCLEKDQYIRQRTLGKIVSDCLNVKTAMEGVYRRFTDSICDLLYWPELSTLESRLDDVQLGKVFPVSFQFPNFFVAQVVITYWVGMLSIHHLLAKVYNKLAEGEFFMVSIGTTDNVLRPKPVGSSPFVLQSCEHYHAWKAMARNICQSVEYFLQDKMGVTGPISIISHLFGCKRNLDDAPEDCSRESSWIGDVIQRIQEKAGFPVSNLFGS
jgi:hypothetical protein